LQLDEADDFFRHVSAPASPDGAEHRPAPPRAKILFNPPQPWNGPASSGSDVLAKNAKAIARFGGISNYSKKRVFCKLLLKSSRPD
jgi:hypothetical protein